MQENGVNWDNEEDDDDDNDAGDEDEGTSNKKTEKDEENTNSDTDNEDFDPWNKLRGEVINDLNPFWEEQEKKIYVRVAKGWCSGSSL